MAATSFFAMFLLMFLMLLSISSLDQASAMKIRRPTSHNALQPWAISDDVDNTAASSSSSSSSSPFSSSTDLPFDDSTSSSSSSSSLNSDDINDSNDVNANANANVTDTFGSNEEGQPDSDSDSDSGAGAGSDAEPVSDSVSDSEGEQDADGLEGPGGVNSGGDDDVIGDSDDNSENGDQGNAPTSSPSPSPVSSSASSEDDGSKGAQKRDWNLCPAIYTAPKSSETGSVCAIGDIHGDYDRLFQLLVGAGIAKQSGLPLKNGMCRYLVILGDFINKWSQSLKVIELLRVLGSKPKKMKLVVLMGNHEAYFLSRQWDKLEKKKGFNPELRLHGYDPQQVLLRQGSDDERALGDFLHCLPMAASIGNHFFSHAGSTRGLTLDQLRDAIVGNVTRFGYGADLLLSDNHGLLAARLGKVAGQSWWEDPSGDWARSARNLSDSISALGATRMVIGHQPGERQFQFFPQNLTRPANEAFAVYPSQHRLFMMDVGLSRGAGANKKVNTGAVLVLSDEGPKIVCADGSAHDFADDVPGIKCSVKASASL